MAITLRAITLSSQIPSVSHSVYTPERDAHTKILDDVVHGAIGSNVRASQVLLYQQSKYFLH